MKKLVIFGSVAALVMAICAKEGKEKRVDTDSRLRLILTMAAR